MIFYPELDWEGHEMTVCIAAGARDKKADRRKIVMCADWRVSSALGSAEIKLKTRKLNENWWCLSAGAMDDIHSIVRLLKANFASAETIDETNAIQIVRGALNKRKSEKVDEFIQGRYAISYSDFLSFGKDKLPTDVHREAILTLSDISIGAACIVVGFASGDEIIIESDERCAVHMRDDFAAIGEGAYLAQSALLQRAHIETADLEHAIYNVFEAKKYAERVNSVGEYTSLSVLDEDGSVADISQDGISFLTDMFKKCGPQHVPGSVVNVLKHLEGG